jgi:L-fuculose-phosphate aldolase
MNLHDAMVKLADTGLNKGTSGNASVRDGNGFLITPSGMPIEEMSLASMVHMRFDGGFEDGKKTF